MKISKKKKKSLSENTIEYDLHSFVPSRLPRATKPGFTLQGDLLLPFPITASGDNSHQTHLHTAFIAC